MPCHKDKHKFIVTDVYTGGTSYKCDRCGLEITVPLFSNNAYIEFYGSYIGGISYKWDPDTMNASHIVEFSMSFGDLPIVNIHYDGVKLKTKNSINFSRDGWMSFPPGFFEEKEILLSDHDKEILFCCLTDMDFSSFVTSPHTFRNLYAPGFSIRESFRCRFSNGDGFECLSPDNTEFHRLVSVVSDLIRSHPPSSPKVPSPPKVPSSLKTPETKTIPGILVPCCEKKIPDFYSFCPYCGKPLTDSNTLASCTVPYDADATVWICNTCSSGNPFEYFFCGKCGSKRTW